MPQAMVEISGIGKRYYLSHSSRPDTLKTYLKSLFGAGAGRDRATEEFWALRDVTLRVDEGQCVALVGKNGSGKSTLLKILSRVIPPTTGLIRLTGRVASLLEIGTGFHVELTGRENIFLTF